MKQRLLAAAAVLVLVLAVPWTVKGTELKVGDKAPDFTLLDTNWKEVKAELFSGQRRT